MNTIAKIIFDTLASGRGINLPEVGSLSVERDAAKFVSRNEIRPPHNRVLYSRRPNPDHESVISFMTATGMSLAQAEKTYTEWLEQAKADKGILEITGVGVLKHDFFYPSVALHDALNPGMQKSIRLKPGRGVWSKVGIGAVVVASVAVVLFFVISVDRYATARRESKALAAQAGSHPQTVRPAGESPAAITRPANENAADAASPEDAIQRQLEDYAAASSDGAPALAPDPSGEQAPTTTVTTGTNAGQPVTVTEVSCWQRFLNIFRSQENKRLPVVAAPAVAESAKEETAAPATVNEEPVQQTAAPAPVTYHVVVGVYSNPQNADKRIAEDLFMAGRQAYRKLLYKDKTMVVIYSSTNERDAIRRRRYLSDFDRDVWVYAEIP